MISRISHDAKNQKRHQEPAVRQAVFAEVFRQTSQGCWLAFGAHVSLESLDIFGRIETEIFRIRTDKAHGVGPPRQIVEPSFLNGCQLVTTEFQRARDVGEIVAPPQSCRAQILTHIARSRSVRRLAGRVSRPATNARLFDRQLRNLVQ